MTRQDPVITAHGLTRYYGKTVGVEGLDLEIRAGEVFGFLGPNGAGKTTAIRLFLDLIRPTRGEAFLFGIPARAPEIRARVGYLPGELFLDGKMSGNQILRFLSRLDGRCRDPVSISRRIGLCNRLGITPVDLARKVREYSRGMKQKIGLVAAFEHNPDLLILDEPTTGLDPLVREVVFQLMAEARDRGATVFHSSHVISEVDRTCDRVAVLRAGKLVARLTVEESRQALSRRMVVDFQAEPPLEALEAAGAVVEGRRGSRVELRVPGDIQPLLEVLAGNPVGYLSFPEPSLEEAFNRYYLDRSDPEPDPLPGRTS